MEHMKVPVMVGTQLDEISIDWLCENDLSISEEATGLENADEEVSCDGVSGAACSNMGGVALECSYMAFQMICRENKEATSSQNGSHQGSGDGRDVACSNIVSMDVACVCVCSFNIAEEGTGPENENVEGSYDGAWGAAC